MNHHFWIYEQKPNGKYTGTGEVFNTLSEAVERAKKRGKGFCVLEVNNGKPHVYEWHMYAKERTVKRTAPVVVQNHDEYGTWSAGDPITCEVTGEWDTGTKVWTDIETGEQYFLFRMLGKYYFCHV